MKNKIKFLTFLFTFFVAGNVFAMHMQNCGCGCQYESDSDDDVVMEDRDSKQPKFVTVGDRTTFGGQRRVVDLEDEIFFDSEESMDRVTDASRILSFVLEKVAEKKGFSVNDVAREENVLSKGGYNESHIKLFALNREKIKNLSLFYKDFIGGRNSGFNGDLSKSIELIMKPIEERLEIAKAELNEQETVYFNDREIKRLRRKVRDKELLLEDYNMLLRNLKSWNKRLDGFYNGTSFSTDRQGNQPRPPFFLKRKPIIRGNSNYNSLHREFLSTQGFGGPSDDNLMDLS